LASNGIPNDVEAFLIDHIDSIDVLEVLLFLFQHPSDRWTALQIARELRINEAQAARRLEQLTHDQLTDRDASASEPAYSFEPADSTVIETIRRLDQVYRERRVGVITLIFSKPSDKIRTFADAFKFWREK
jgi:AraC-like DNA-binding protein